METTDPFFYVRTPFDLATQIVRFAVLIPFLILWSIPLTPQKRLPPKTDGVLWLEGDVPDITVKVVDMNGEQTQDDLFDFKTTQMGTLWRSRLMGLDLIKVANELDLSPSYFKPILGEKAEIVGYHVTRAGIYMMRYQATFSYPRLNGWISEVSALNREIFIEFDG